MTFFDTPDWNVGAPVGANLPIYTGTATVAPGGALPFPAKLPINQFNAIVVSVIQDVAEAGIYQVDWTTAGPINQPCGPTVSWRKNTASQTQVMLPVVGPTIQMLAENNGAANMDITANIYGVVGIPRPVDAFPVSQVVSVTNDPIGGGGANVYYPTVTTPGMYHVWTYSNQAMILEVDVWTGSAWTVYDQTAIAAGDTSSKEVPLPLSDWRLRAANVNGIAGVVYASVGGPY